MKKWLLVALIALASFAHAEEARQHFEGVVTFSDMRRRFFYVLDNHDETLRFTYPYGRKSPNVGTYIAVSGVLRDDDKRMPMWERAEFVELSNCPGLIPLPEETTISSLVKSPREGGQGAARNGRPVEVDGFVDKVTVYGDETRIDVQEDGARVTIIILAQANASAPEFVKPGARVKISGAFECIYDYRILPGQATVVNPYIYITDPKTQLSLVLPPTFWTRERAINLNMIVGGILFASLLWILGLNYLVRRRTNELVKVESAKARADIEHDAVQRERLRLSYDLHDDLQQLLAGTMCRLKAGLNYLGREDGVKAEKQFKFAQQAVSQTQTSLRHILWELHDSAEGPGSLSGLFTYVAKRFPEWEGKVHIETVGEEPDIARRYSGGFLMIMQEAVGNALKYAEADNIWVGAVYRQASMMLVIADDGKGFVPEAAARNPSQLGLASMRLRSKQMGGEFSILSVPNEGTIIRITIPFNPGVKA